MSNFREALPIVLGHEGGWSDHPADRGGKTNFGVTQTTYDAWRARQSLPQRPVSDIERHEVEAVYKEIWDHARCDGMEWPVSLIYFDMRVNHRPADAARMLQRALGVKDDGVHGPKTQAAIESFSPYELAERMLWVRLRFYYDISKGDQLVFLRGWLDRVIRLREKIA